MRPDRDTPPTGLHESSELSRLTETENTLKEALQDRDEFLSVAAHELLTPVTSLQLAVQSMLRVIRKHPPSGGSAENVKRVLDVTERECKRLAKLVDGLLDCSRIATGKCQLEREQVDLTSLVQETIATLRSSHESPVVLSVGSPVVGSWDRARIGQALENLLSTAIQYREGSPIEAKVEAQGNTATLTVKAYGPGMVPETQKDILLGRAGSARKSASLGFGVQMAKRIVEAHGGSVVVESEPNMGSTFIMKLPVLGIVRESD